MPDVHAKLCSPSGADGWFACPGRAVMEAAFPDKGNEYSDDGTARHAVCAMALAAGGNVAAFVGRVIDVGDGKTVAYREDWVEEDQDYVSTINALAGIDSGADLFIEQVVNFERYTEVKGDSFGTADAVILKPIEGGRHELIVADRKTGYHEVPVERNKQLMLYALGAYDEHSLVYDITNVRLIIHQRGAREWDCSVGDLLKFAGEARSRAITVQNAVAMHGQVDQAEWERTFLNQDPSESACKYCRAMAVCPSMQRKVQETVGADFESMASANACPPSNLPAAMAATGLIEDWIKAVRAEVERQLLAGTDVPGFKLVLGKQGNRKWVDDKDVESTLKAMRLKVEEMYDLSVISPTTAEKLTKGDKPAIGPKQWKKLQGQITRSDPKPSVAPVTDKRDAYVPPKVEDDFTTVADEATDLA